jgi:hypothetical protein
VTPPPTRLPPFVALAFAAALALAAAGCGEKSEPDVSQLPPPPQPQAPSPPEGLPEAVIGRWQGTLRQQRVKPFEIRVSILSATDRDRNIVHYGGEIDCSGTWAYRGTDGATVRFEELITSGAGDRCKGRGDVTVTAERGTPGRLGYVFRGGGVESQGVLQRP